MKTLKVITLLFLITALAASAAMADEVQPALSMGSDYYFYDQPNSSAPDQPHKTRNYVYVSTDMSDNNYFTVMSQGMSLMGIAAISTGTYGGDWPIDPPDYNSISSPWSSYFASAEYTGNFGPLEVRYTEATGDWAVYDHLWRGRPTSSGLYWNSGSSSGNFFVTNASFTQPEEALNTAVMGTWSGLAYGWTEEQQMLALFHEGELSDEFAGPPVDPIIIDGRTWQYAPTYLGSTGTTGTGVNGHEYAISLGHGMYEYGLYGDQTTFTGTDSCMYDIDTGTFSDSSANYVNVNEGTFSGSSTNSGTVISATFNNTSHNAQYATVANGIFNDDSWNDGAVTSGVGYFYDDSENSALGTVRVGQFNGNSINDGEVTSLATFNDLSGNYGTVYDAIFNGTNTNDGTVTGTATVSGTLTGTGTMATVKGSGSLLNMTFEVGEGITLSPGNSPGTMTIDGGTLEWLGGGTLDFEIQDALGTAGTDWDLVALINSAVLDIQATSGDPFNIDIIGLSLTNFDPESSFAWMIVDDTGGSITGFDASQFAFSVSGFPEGVESSDFYMTSGSLELNYNDGGAPAGVPEPATVVGLGLMVIAAGLRRMRKHARVPISE